jgi:hypothetical protein
LSPDSISGYTIQNAHLIDMTGNDWGSWSCWVKAQDAVDRGCDGSDGSWLWHR